jgi:aspartate aminotransferase
MTQVHLNPQVSSLRPSATLAINEKSVQLAREGREVYRLGFGQSPFPPPARLIEALQAHAAQKDYLPVRGLAELRAAVAYYHQSRHGVQATADDILIGPGSKELMFHTQLAYQAELVLPAPSWVSYQPQAHLLGLPTVWLQTRPADGWRLSPDQLARHCRNEPARPRLLVLNYPNNPAGTTYGADELAALARVARKFRLLALSDEIYGELHYRGAHLTLAQFYPEGTIISSGLSKWCGVGGWRLGTFCFPKELRWLQDALAGIGSETYSTVAAPVQFAAVTAFRGGADFEEYLQQTRRVLRVVGPAVCGRLNELGVETVWPEGGFYLFPDFTRHAEALRGRGIRTGAELCARLLAETGVALLPGEAFGRPAQELTCRLAYVDFDGRTILAAAEANPEGELNDEFCRRYCGKVLQAIELIGAWLAREAAA